ncbi:MAG: tetratricopeptide repeat protein [Melioribacteraceae bacterium]
MRRNYLYMIIFFIPFIVSGQSLRELNNDGVEKYKGKNYSDAEVAFKKGIEKDSSSFQPHFNLGDALYKQNRLDEAIKSFKKSAEMTEDDVLKAKAYHNLGNTYLQQKKYKESIEAYKNSLKKNPQDIETKYNLSYALNQLQQQQNQDKNQDKNKDKNKDDKQNQDQNQKNQDQKKNDDKKDKDKQDQQQKQQQQKDQISKEEAERILQALKNNENDIQKKIRKIKGKPVRNEKDW